MKTTRLITEQVTRLEIEEVECDFCDATGAPIGSNITSFKIDPGYGSKYDLEVFNFDICDSCLEDVILRRANGYYT